MKQTVEEAAREYSRIWGKIILMKNRVLQL